MPAPATADAPAPDLAARAGASQAGSWLSFTGECIVRDVIRCSNSCWKRPGCFTQKLKAGAGLHRPSSGLLAKGSARARERASPRATKPALAAETGRRSSLRGRLGKAEAGVRAPERKYEP